MDQKSSAVRRRGAAVTTRKADDRAALIAAYRQGLGLAGIAVVRDSAGVRVAAVGHTGSEGLAAAETVQARWWCRRAAEAERVVAAANARRRRPRAGDVATGAPSAAAQRRPTEMPDMLPLTRESVVRAAKQYDVVLQADEDLDAEAMQVIARVDEEVERLQRAGELKSVNKSYQQYRIETSGRGERVMRYQDWMRQYRRDFVVKLAATLRFF